MIGDDDSVPNARSDNVTSASCMETDAKLKKKKVSKKKVGRKTRLTEQVQREICGHVNAGAPIPYAANASGVPWPTVRDWLKKGRAGEQPYADFVAAIKEAKAKWVTGAVRRVNRAGKKNWKADAWMLERRVKAFRPPQRVEQKIDMNVSSTDLREALERAKANQKKT